MASTRPPRHRPTKVRSPRGSRDTLKRRSLELVRKIAEKDKYGIFLDPVNVDEVPGYTNVIARPMDISTVRSNTNMGVYQTPSELRADLDLIWANCIKFNANDTIYYKEAVRLRSLAGKLFEEYLRILDRDGLPFGPRASGASGAAASTTQLRAAAASADVKNVSMQSVSERLRNIARARLKALREARPNEEPTDLERAASSTANTLFPPADKHQIFDGPYQRLRRFPNAHGSVTFPYVRGTRLERLRKPFPPAWRALGRWQPCNNEEPSLTCREREREMHFAEQYQNFVTQSAPVARRLVAAVLDPLAVVEHDAEAEREANRIGAHLNVNTCGNTVNDSPKKRPRHGNNEPEPMDVSVDKARSERRKGAGVGKMPSANAISDLREALKAHNIDDSFLTAILNPSNPSSMTQATAPNDKKSAEATDCNNLAVKDMDTSSTEVTEGEVDANAPPKSKLNEDELIEKAENVDGCKGTGIANEDTVEEEDDGTVDEDAEMGRLLQTNHETMQNILRLRALKELAVGESRKDLEEEEIRHAKALKRGVVEVTGKLQPRMLIPKAQATAYLLDASKEYLRKRKREEEESEQAVKKSKIGTAGDSMEGAAEEEKGNTDGTEESDGKNDGKSKGILEANGIGTDVASSATKATTGKVSGSASKTVGSSTQTGGVTVASVMEKA